MNTLRKKILRAQMPLLVFCLFIGIWEFTIWFNSWPPYLLPGPWDVLSLVPKRFGDLSSSFLITLGESITGFFLSAVLGVAASLIFAVSPLARRTLLPYVVLVQTIPIIAVSPLIILWLGNNSYAVCFIALVICLPPIVVNVTQGLISVEQNLVDLFLMSNASTFTILFKLRLPHALPSLFTGLRIASGVSVVGAIVGETFAGSASVGQGGLGYALIYVMGQSQTPYLFALVLASSLMGLAFFFFVSTAEWLCLRHWHESVLAD